MIDPVLPEFPLQEENATASRLASLRARLKGLGLSGLVVPHADEHLSEYIGEYARRLRWLTGFTGSAGGAIVLRDAAAIFVDGRYTIQVRAQTDAAHWQALPLDPDVMLEWISALIRPGDRIGYDPRLHARTWVETFRAGLSAAGATLTAVDPNPIDLIWPDQPARGGGPLRIHRLTHAGVDSAAKRRDVAASLQRLDADLVVLTALDSIAWLFNLRGSDVPHTPVALAYAIVRADGSAELFACPGGVDPDVKAHLGAEIGIHAYDEFAAYLQGLPQQRICIDHAASPAAFLDAIERSGSTLVDHRDPTVLPKAIKNPVEIAGHRRAQLRDGVAMCKFLHWLSLEGPSGQVTEIEAADRLEGFRRDSGELQDLAFDTISATAAHGAIIHYRPTRQSNRRIETGSLYLSDSGGQYLDGTTDVTRTVAIGTPTEEMRERFTDALRGHIALATAVFPEGTNGGQLDSLARQYLWMRGLDYPYGTGHGVGSYLSGHEGPQRIACKGYTSEPLRPGMILSNEPGYYKTGSYGLRIENLMLVERREIAGSEQVMLGFEILTLAPIDKSLILESSLSPCEIAWLDDYHERVFDTLAPHLPEATADWLRMACRPLAQSFGK